MLTEDFLKTVFGTAEGYLFLSTKYAPSDKEITNHKPFRYPENLKQAVAYAAVRDDEDLYFSPMLYQVPRRRAASVSATPVVYADTDTFPIEEFLVPPSINIETSPGRHASLWILDGEYSKEDVEAASRAIALTHARTEDGKQAGVDPGGWDLTQLLRVPNSMNLKFEVQGKYEGYTEPYKVFVDEARSPLTIYSLEEITSAYDPANLPDVPQRASMEMPPEDSLPAAADVLRRITASRQLSDMYGKEPKGNQDWSDTLYRFISEMLRAGFTAEEAFVGAWYAACNKYKRDGRPMEDLWQYDMRKALADPQNRPRATVEAAAWEEYKHPKDEGISTAIEVALLTPDQQPTATFVDEYVRWAASRTDAPAPYHIASAMTILSCIFGEWGIGYPQFGELRLGLNFVIMGETTDTRKTTSRNLMKSMLRACQDSDEFEYILTSDATGESLLDTLAERADQSSLYDRDEAQQLIDDIKGGKGYLKGFFETLNELYDGWAHGRLRAGKHTKDTKVNFVQYLMGIRSQIQENLELHDFASGWGPRNIFVRGESPQRTRENSRLKQGNLDGSSVDVQMMKLVDKLTRARTRWERNVKDRSNPKVIMFDDDAWILMTDLEWDLKDYFNNHPRYEVLKPCIERLTINAMKVAILFAMSEVRTQVNIQDVINVRSYAAKWMEDLLIVVEGVNESIYLRDVRALERYIADHDGLITYGAALKWGLERGLDRRQFSELVEALVEQETIQIVTDANNRRSLSLEQ